MQTSGENESGRIAAFLREYCNVAKSGFRERWKNYTPELYHSEISEVIGGLAARQTTLAIEMARNPGIWNGHIAPLVLRCMTDTHITLAWILVDPLDRSKEYIRYGLGQEKLFIEYLENDSSQAPEGELDEEIAEMIRVRKSWLNSQLAEWAIEINVGAWSGKSTREMAIEAGCDGLYKFAYVPFSGPAHSMWQHVGVYNAVSCENPLHKDHRIPVVPTLKIDPDYLYRSAKYLTRTFELLTLKLGLACDIPLPLEYFVASEPFSVAEDADDGQGTV
jgi:Family of unknown function (DUF5677)